MSQELIREFIRDMPGFELHLHIEGSFEPALVFKIAERNGLEVKIERAAPQNAEDQAAIDKLKTKAEAIGLTPEIREDGSIKVVFDTPEQLAEAYKFDNLQEFLDIYYAGMNVLQTEQDFYDLTMAYLEKCYQENIVHTEIFFDPQGHTSRGVSFDTAINGIHQALKDGENKFDMSTGLIMSYLRHLPEEDALKTWEQAQPHLDKIIGVGLDSSEMGNPPRNFKNVFALARMAGLYTTAHAGEEGPAEYVWEALDVLKVDRIDHGNRSMEDPILVKRLAKEGMTLTVCPLSNDKLQVVDDLAKHPIPDMLDEGLGAMVNSDDPAYFGGYLKQNFLKLQEATDLDLTDIIQLNVNAIKGSFLPQKEKRIMLEMFQEYIEDFLGDYPEMRPPGFRSVVETLGAPAPVIQPDL